MLLCETGIRTGDIFLDKQPGKDFDRKIYRRMLELLDAEEIAAAKMRGVKFGRLRIRLPQRFSEVKTLYESKSFTLHRPHNNAECAVPRFGRRRVDKTESHGNSRVHGQRFPQILLKILLFSARL